MEYITLNYTKNNVEVVFNRVPTVHSFKVRPSTKVIDTISFTDAQDKSFIEEFYELPYKNH